MQRDQGPHLGEGGGIWKIVICCFFAHKILFLSYFDPPPGTPTPLEKTEMTSLKETIVGIKRGKEENHIHTVHSDSILNSSLYKIKFCLLCVSLLNMSEFLYLDWHIAVISVLLFSASFGLIAIVLAICGVCTSALPTKIYYYHSSGEGYFLSGL